MPKRAVDSECQSIQKLGYSKIKTRKENITISLSDTSIDMFFTGIVYVLYQDLYFFTLNFIQL